MLKLPAPDGPGGKLNTRRTPSGVLPLCVVLLLPLLLGGALPSPGVTTSLDKGLVQAPPRCTNNCQPAKG
jgi:hypothetical protein